MITELLKENHSGYLSQKGKRDKLKLLTVPGIVDRLAISDRKIWIRAREEDEAWKDYKELGVYYEKDGALEKNIFDILEDESKKPSIVMGNNKMELWNSIWGNIYFKKGNEEVIKCSYRLFREIFDYLAKLEKQQDNQKDWYEYVKEILDSRGEGKEGWKEMQENIKLMWDKKNFREEEEND